MPAMTIAVPMILLTMLMLLLRLNAMGTATVIDLTVGYRPQAQTQTPYRRNTAPLPARLMVSPTEPVLFAFKRQISNGQAFIA